VPEIVKIFVLREFSGASVKKKIPCSKKLLKAYESRSIFSLVSESRSKSKGMVKKLLNIKKKVIGKSHII
jgi:hypothetical protein